MGTSLLIFLFIYKKYLGLANGRWEIIERLEKTIFEKLAAKWFQATKIGATAPTVTPCYFW